MESDHLRLIYTFGRRPQNYSAQCTVYIVHLGPAAEELQDWECDILVEIETHQSLIVTMEKICWPQTAIPSNAFITDQIFLQNIFHRLCHHHHHQAHWHPWQECPKYNFWFCHTIVSRIIFDDT